MPVLAGRTARDDSTGTLREGMAEQSASAMFETLMRQLSMLPLWVKQVIYIQLKRELEQCMTQATLSTFSESELLQFWIPELTKQGRMAIEERPGMFSREMSMLLRMVLHHKNVVAITASNQWSLAEASQVLLDAISQEFIMRPHSGIVLATMNYIVGNTRLGEYLVNINRLTTEQLDQALRTQKYIQDTMGQKTGIANVLINLGYINKQDTEAILFIKEESKKPFTGLPNVQSGWSTAKTVRPPGTV